jgi:hypothetical protein
MVAGAILAALLAWLFFGGKKQTRPNPNPVIAVTTTRAAVRDFPVVVTALGAAQAWQGVLIRTQVNGKLMSVPVSEGTMVKKGQILAEIDPAPSPWTRARWRPPRSTSITPASPRRWMAAWACASSIPAIWWRPPTPPASSASMRSIPSR